MANKLIGVKFFKKETGELIRIIKKKNNKFIYYNEEDTNHTAKEMDSEKLDDYTRLTESAIISFSTVLISTENGLTKPLRDVIVLVMRKSDKTEQIVCRQFIPDIFYQIINPNSTKKGCCVSRDNCPTNIKFDVLKSCEKLVSTTAVSIYLDDTKETILNLIKNQIKAIDKIFDKQKYLIKYYEGIAETIEQLLDETNFWGEVEKSFDIIKLKTPIINNTLSIEQLVYLQNKISYLISNVDIIEYWYDIDFPQIKGDYMILKDSNNKLYLLSYLKGNFIKEKGILSDEEFSKFKSIKL